MDTFKVKKRPRCLGRKIRASSLTATDLKKRVQKPVFIRDELHPLSEEEKEAAEALFRVFEKAKNE